MNLIVSPVGPDADLRGALEDLKLGRFASTHDLLVRTGENWSLRARRAQQLVAGASDRSVIKMWRDVEPNNAHAVTLWARALTEAALELNRGGGNTSTVGRAMAMAYQEWKRAQSLWPKSPEPWIGRLQLAQLVLDPRAVDPYWNRRIQPWERLDDPVMHLAGPWPLLHEINWRDPGSREGHHRMREYFLHRHGTAVALQYVHWLVAGRVVNPELLVLPLYALMDVYRQRHGQGQAGALGFFQTDQVRHFAVQAYDQWFLHVPDTEHAWLSPWDLNYLAHALVACGETHRAARVFQAMGPYAVPQPWQDINASLGRSKDWTLEFLRIRSSVLR
ncbi:hypothetical protein [Streptomyces cylindrosporus]|uniref:Uncharacterized protein n=1 Tax=Streptomyces cylindrosporus TaxID=2927583 RepID=A0ABS9Y8Z9_9ACTN|nr:hypothetical protein [Streptomyces cylindrosporus]MCI3273434.1 hypothetical protein [Streptomyces cylindrosporus]